MRKKTKSKRQRRQSSGSKKLPQKKAPAAAKNTKQASTPAAVLDSEKLKSLYAMMLQCRRLSKKETQVPARRLNGGEQLIVGREAVLVGAASHALPEDRVIASSALQRLVAQLFSISDLQPANTSSLPALEHGMALAQEMKGQRKAAIVFCGADNAATVADDSLAQAARAKLPLVCVIEIALSMVDAEQSRQRDNNPAQKDMQSFFPRIAVDGTDVVAMFRVAQEAVRRARSGHGPSLIQCVMPDTVHGARNKENDALAFMEGYLRRRKLWSDELRKNDRAKVKKV